MSNLKQAKSVAFASISAAQTILEKYPNLLTTNSFISLNASANPIEFLIDLIKTSGGYDNLIKLMSKFLILELGIIEASVKTILLTSFRNIIACGINPMISYDLIKNGIWFDLSQIDVNGQLIVNPLDPKLGKYFYFGCDPINGIKNVDDLYMSEDLNAVLWYTVNRANGDNKRVIWDNSLSLPEEDRGDSSKIKPVITLEFVERSSELTDISGNKILNPIPLNNLVHIFLGDAKNTTNVEDNRYWKKTLIEFNANYINSIKLFDPTVVAAQIIDRITGVLSVNLSLTAQQLITQYQIENVVKKIIEYDDAEINDCFFSFTNEQYDEMLSKSQLQHAGFFSYDGETNTNNPINPEEILKSLDGISSSASKEEQITLIEGAMYEVSGLLSNTYESKDINFSVQMNFVEKIIYELSVVIISSILSPKVYLLLAVNISLMGLPGLPTAQDFISGYKNMIKQIIILIKDMLIRYMFNYLMDILKPLLTMLASKITIESILFYKELISQLIKACSFKREDGIFNMDIVNYADIVNENSTQISETQC